jgi:cysteine desulfurase
MVFGARQSASSRLYPSLATQRAIGNEAKNARSIAVLNSLLRSHFSKRENIVINSPEKASSYIVNVSLTDKKASVIVEALSNLGIMISSVSACHAKTDSASYVVQALGRNEDLARNTLRISLIGFTIEEVKAFIRAFDEIMDRFAHDLRPYHDSLGDLRIKVETKWISSVAGAIIRTN